MSTLINECWWSNTCSDKRHTHSLIISITCTRTTSSVYDKRLVHEGLLMILLGRQSCDRMKRVT